jgi:hypothetical protein
MSGAHGQRKQRNGLDPGIRHPDLSLEAADGVLTSHGAALGREANGIASLIESFDWTATALGPPKAWPLSLRTTLNLVLHSKFPMCFAWGSDLTLLYNEAYAGIIGSKHPRVLGQPLPQAWSEIWPNFRGLVEATLAG